MTWQSEVNTIKSVLLKHPEEAFVNDENIQKQWSQLNYLDRPDFGQAMEQYHKLSEYIASMGSEVLQLPHDENCSLDSIYVRDAAISTDKGMIICNMGKLERGAEPAAQKAFFQSRGLPIKGEIKSPGTLEGGDVAWMDEKTLAVARGYRTNAEGIRQLKELVSDVCDEVIVFHSPHYRGPSDVFHLMSVYSPVNHNTAVVYSPLMPVTFREELVKREIRLIEVPEEEFETLGCNVLAISPENCVITKGNPITTAKLRDHGIQVFEYEGSEISLKGCGGPTCLTRPLERQSS